MLDFERQDHLIAAAGLDQELVSFRLSKVHAESELSLIRLWQDTLVAVGLAAKADQSMAA